MGQTGLDRARNVFIPIVFFNLVFYSDELSVGRTNEKCWSFGQTVTPVRVCLLRDAPMKTYCDILSIGI